MDHCLNYCLGLGSLLVWAWFIVELCYSLGLDLLPGPGLIQVGVGLGVGFTIGHNFCFGLDLTKVMFTIRMGFSLGFNSLLGWVSGGPWALLKIKYEENMHI